MPELPDAVIIFHLYIIIAILIQSGLESFFLITNLESHQTLSLVFSLFINFSQLTAFRITLHYSQQQQAHRKRDFESLQAKEGVE